MIKFITEKATKFKGKWDFYQNSKAWQKKMDVWDLTLMFRKWCAGNFHYTSDDINPISIMACMNSGIGVLIKNMKPFYTKDTIRKTLFEYLKLCVFPLG